MNTRVDEILGLLGALAIVMAGLLTTLLLLIARENSVQLVWLVASYCGVFMLAAMGLTVLGNRYVGWKAASSVAAGMVAASSYSLYFVHLNFAGASVGAALLFGGIFWLLVHATRGKYRGRLIGAVALAATPIISADDIDLDVNLAGNSDQMALLDAYSGIRFRERPNIYLIGFDALIPREAAKLLLGVDETIYDQAARAMGATVEDNVFAANTPSIESFDSLMVLDNTEHFDGVGYFAGRLASPVSVLFRANGYLVETGTSIPFYFGGIGPAINNQIHPTKNILSDSSLCRFASEMVYAFGVFGLCRFEPLFGTSLLFDEETDIYDSHAVYFDSRWHEMVLAQIATPPADQPRLAVYYYYYPIGHADNDFESSDPSQLLNYRKRFQIQMVKAAEVLAELDRAIRQADSEAVIFYFGDHGTKISRTVDKKRQKAFWVRDNHAVFFASSGKEVSCTQATKSVTYRGDGYSTIGRNFAALIRCMADEPARIDELVHFVDKYDFSQYLLPPW